MADRRLIDRFPVLRRLERSAGRGIPEVQQTAESDCGAACLTMVLAYHGKRMRLDEVRETLGIARDGVDALGLLAGARHFGLRGRGVKVDDVGDLRYMPKGSILHWNFHHFVVFEAMDGNGISAVDPSIGRRSISEEELRRSFTGIALQLEPGEDFEPGKERSRGPARYLREVLGQRGVLGRVLLISLFLRLLALATPLVTGILVDRVVPRGDVSLLTVVAVGLSGVTVFFFLSELIRAHLMLHLRTVLDTKITLEFLEHLVALPYAFFHQRSTGDLMMRLNSNQTIREILTSSALTGLLDGLLVSSYLLLLYITHAGLATVVLVLGLLRVALYVATRRRHRELMSQGLVTQARSRGYQVEMLSGIETLKAMGAEQQAVERWANLFVDELNISLARGRLDALFEALLRTLETASPFLVLTYGVAEVLTGNITLGTMLAVAALATGFLQPLSSLVQTGVQLQLLRSYLDRIEDVMDTPREQDPTEVVAAPPLSGRITLENVSFRYSPMRPWVVRDVSLEIEPGSFVALVGTSGAGKSTLASILVGLYRPTAGAVLFDGIGLDRIDLRTLRKQMGIVLQQPYLFGDSIRNNISLGQPGLPLHRVVAAAKQAYIHEHIHGMPLGYQTVLADGGLSLSGGQRQRLALARALASRPAVLLLDEATSHLDVVSEQRVQEELERMRITRIVIAHRLSTVVNADQILVLDDGRVVQRGRHGELLAVPGPYRDLVQAQLETAEEEPDSARSRASAPNGGAVAPSPVTAEKT
ncbi:MAG: peptidase domain-containing ABC transporter [Holophagales bacterium]|nr:peptidase domain-containing ABC transporter [Holophagales bacterium]